MRSLLVIAIVVSLAGCSVGCSVNAPARQEQMFIPWIPQLCRDVRDASLEGWRYAAAHPDEAVDLIMRLADEVGYTVNRLLLRSMLLSILPSIFPESSESGVLPWTPGLLSRSAYESTVAMMNEVFVGDQWNVSYDIFHPVGVEAAEMLNTPC